MPCQGALRWRRSGAGVGKHDLCVGLDHHRLVAASFSRGPIFAAPKRASSCIPNSICAVRFRPAFISPAHGSTTFSGSTNWRSNRAPSTSWIAAIFHRLNRIVVAGAFFVTRTSIRGRGITRSESAAIKLENRLWPKRARHFRGFFARFVTAMRKQTGSLSF